MTIQHNLVAFWGMGGQRRYLKDNFLSYAENPGAYQRADVAQQMSQLPDQRQLRKWSGSITISMHLSKGKGLTFSPFWQALTQSVFCVMVFLELTTEELPLPSKGQDLQSWSNVTEHTRPASFFSLNYKTLLFGFH